VRRAAERRRQSRDSVAPRGIELGLDEKDTAGQIGTAEVGIPEISPEQIGHPQVGAAEVGRNQESAAQRRPGEIDAAKLGTDEVGTAAVRPLPRGPGSNSSLARCSNALASWRHAETSRSASASGPRA
jgi:hypothetical protein